MKKLLTLSFAVVMLACSSCKKHCGYCDYNNGVKGATYCESDSKENYASVKRACDAYTTSTWRVTE